MFSNGLLKGRIKITPPKKSPPKRAKVGTSAGCSLCFAVIGLEKKGFEFGDVLNARIWNRADSEFLQPMQGDAAFFGDNSIITFFSNQGFQLINATHNFHDHSVVKSYYKNKQNFTNAKIYAAGMNDEAKNLARNLRRLMEFFKVNQKEVAAKAGVSQKTISNMLNPGDEKSPQLSVIEKVAKSFGVKTWHLLLPNCPDELLLNHTIERLVENYMINDATGRNATLSVSEIRAQYLEGPKIRQSNGG